MKKFVSLIFVALLPMVALHSQSQSDCYYNYKGDKIPLTLNEDAIVISIPKDCAETSERLLSNLQILTTIKDEIFDIFVIARSEYEKLTSMDNWEEDSKSVILTSSYYTEQNKEVFASPYLNLRLKKEQDIDLLNSCVEEYKLQITEHSYLMPLWYILSLTLESEKNSVECANELYETGFFSAVAPDLVSSGSLWFDDQTGIASPLEETGEAGIYDLQGRKVATPRKGIYIKDGQKVLIK